MKSWFAACFLLLPAVAFGAATTFPELPPASRNAGSETPDFFFRDLAGGAHWLSEFLRAGPLVVAMRDVDCPVSIKMTPKLARFRRELEARGVSFVFVNVVKHPRKALAADAKALGGVYVDDAAAAEFQGRFSVASTAEVFLIGRDRRLVYRGPLDDQFGVTYARPRPTSQPVADAVERLLRGESVEPRAVPAPGCLVAPVAAAAPAGGPTFYREISHILDRRCASCHFPGSNARMTFEDYEVTKSRANMIRYTIENALMPPWFADRDTGPWRNDPRLTDDEKRTIFAWIDAKCPPGDPADATPPAWRHGSAGGWRVSPNMVLASRYVTKIPKEGEFPIQYLWLKPKLRGEGFWIRSIEVQSTRPRNLHHISVYSSPRKFPHADQDFPEDRVNFLLASGPGQPLFFQADPGEAIYFPPDSYLLVGLHFTPNGTAGTNVAKVGLVVSREKPRSRFDARRVLNVDFTIPAGAPNFEVDSDLRVEEDTILKSIFPHMHLRGKAAVVELEEPGGQRREIFRASKYNYFMQMNYVYREPIPLRAGSRLRCREFFDNSAGNPANPTPNEPAQGGLMTSTEMATCYFSTSTPVK
jgi:hypothetical protein